MGYTQSGATYTIHQERMTGEKKNEISRQEQISKKTNVQQNGGKNQGDQWTVLL